MSEDQHSLSHGELYWRCVHFSGLSIKELHRCMAVRQEVFILEQRCFYLDADAFDSEAYHLMALEKNGLDSKLVAYLRMYYHHNAWHIGRVLVIKEKRGYGLGKQLMQRCHEELIKLNQSLHAPIEISAQVQVLKFYDKLGYKVFGEQYEDAGIPHQNMRLDRLHSPSHSLTHLSTIIFDFDGTLIDSAYDYAVSFQRLAREWDAQLPLPKPEKVRELMFAGIFPQLEYALGPLDDTEVQRALERFRKICLETPLTYTEPYPGIVDLLGTLKKAGYRLAICTNRCQSLCLQDLEALGLSAYFEVVVGGDSGWKRKPDPEMLFEIFRLMQVNPDSCVLVGDSMVDVKAAQAAGCSAIAVHWGYTPPSAFQNCSQIQVSHAHELKRLFIR